MRHAKTESPYTLKRDFDRMLTEKGEKDALEMGGWLNSAGMEFNLILSSTAERTRQTTELVCKAMHIEESMVRLQSDLYHASPEIFFNVIRSLPDTVKNVLIVSHNDGITHFANMLTDARIDYMQPASVFAVSCNCETWEFFQESEREFVFYKQP